MAQSFALSQRFTGQVLDEETGLYWYGARYYDPALGRFIQADTVIPDLGNPQTLNRYAYAGNNPLKYVDPSGHWLEDLVIGLPSLALGVKSLISNVREGNVRGAIVDSVGILADGAAIALPGVPGGAGLAIKGARAVSRANEVVQRGNAVVEAGQAASEGDLLGAAQAAAGAVGGKPGRKSGSPQQNAVQPYEPGRAKDLKNRSTPNDELDIDHQPSKAAKLEAARRAKGGPLTAAEAQAVIDNGTAVAVPAGVHKAGPTYAGKNTPSQINSDSGNLPSAAARDADAMIGNAAAADKGAAQRAADWIKQNNR